MNKPLINYCCYVKGEESHGLIVEDSDIHLKPLPLMISFIFAHSLLNLSVNFPKIVPQIRTLRSLTLVEC